jgi:hypothetical protein
VDVTRARVVRLTHQEVHIASDRRLAGKLAEVLEAFKLRFRGTGQHIGIA